VKNRFKKLIGDSSGQGTVEFALICAGFLSLLLALGALWHAFQSGTFVAHALLSASHHLSEVAPGVIGDVFLY
jgi:Flp pilus assembly protein TadG